MLIKLKVLSKRTIARFLVAGIVFLIAFTYICTTRPTTLRVPQDYATIQGAINAANEGDTILVSEGIYRESVMVNKTLTLFGENRNTTIIDSSGLNLGAGVIIRANNVRLTGFTIQNCGVMFSPGGWGAVPGVYVWQQSSGSIITNNIIVNASTGVRLESCDDSVIRRNTVINNKGSGISLRGSNNIIENNVLMNNGECGIYIHSGGGNTVRGNTIVNHETGIYIVFSNGNTVSRNSVVGNRWVGIHLGAAAENTIVENDVRNNGFGPEFKFDLYRMFAAGFFVEGFRSNTFYHNNVINNSKQVNRPGGNNTWDNGVEGNYWSDYAGEDLDGDSIGDTPHVINIYNQDNYPLIEPWTEPPWWDIYGTVVATVIVVISVIIAGTAALVSLYSKRFKPETR